MNAEIGIVGGTGFYRFFAESEEVDVDTEYGRPSAPISIADVEGKGVAFVPRHGRHHEYLPSEVPYRANLAALKACGADRIIAFNTVGSLQPKIRRGDFVFCDQFVDRTSGRVDSIFTGPHGAHISSADPYCPMLRKAAFEAVQDLPNRFHPSGTVVVIQGPRFSTRAESLWFTQMGWDVVNMTQYPEVVIARELELCYMNLSYITDYDVAAKEIVAGDSRNGSEPVSHAMVIREFSLNEGAIERVVRTLVRSAVATDECTCRGALVGARVER